MLEADALPLSDPVGARTFSNLGADAVLQAHSGDDYHATLAIGARRFHYKPDPSFDWVGPVANARLIQLVTDRMLFNAFSGVSTVCTPGSTSYC